MRDPSKLQVSSGGGVFLAVFGLPFLLAGLFVIVAPSFGVEIQSEGGGQATLATRLILGGVFSVIGGALVFGRAGYAIDRGRDELIQWWGLAFLPLRQRTRSLSEFELVALQREVRTSSSSNGGSKSYVVYPVKLRAKQGEDEELESPRLRQAARKRAEQVAKFLELGMADASEGSEVIRPAGTLDHSLREQLRDDPPPPPAQPTLNGARYATEGRAAVVEIPPPGFFRAGGLRGLLGFLPLTVFAAFVLTTMLPESGDGFRYVVFAFVGIPALALLAPLAAAVVLGQTRERLTISPDAVEIERSGPLGTRSRRVAMEELEQVSLPSAPNASRALFQPRGVALQTDEAQVQVGLGLEPEAQSWLRELIRYVAACGRAPEVARR